MNFITQYWVWIIVIVLILLLIINLIKAFNRISLLSNELERWQVGHITASRWFAEFQDADVALEVLADFADGKIDSSYISGVRDDMRKKRDKLFITLTPAEIQSNYNRVRWAEGLIRQLPENHDGRNSWLLNYGTKETT